jgi:hypothetical protein
MWNLNIWMTTIKEAIQIVNGLAYQLIFTLMWKSDQNLYVLNGLHVNEILTFKKFQLSGPQKNIYVSSNYGCYNHNVSKFSLDQIPLPYPWSQTKS